MNSRSYLGALTATLISALVLHASQPGQGPKKDAGKNVPLPAISTPAENKNSPKSHELPGTQPLSIDVDLVNVDVVVTDRDGNPVNGLTKKDFKVFDDNVEQTVTMFNPSDEPLTIVVLLEFGETFGYYFDDVVEPAAGFINSLRPEDWAALMAYDLRPEILVDFTRNKNQLFDGLRRLQIPAYRETCLYDAVWDTLDRLDNIDGKRAIFLLSTGLDTISKHSYPDLLKKAQASDIMIYPVSMGQEARLYFESMGRMSGERDITFVQADNVLRSLAEASGGTAFYPRFQGEFNGIFQMVSAQLRNEYSLAFIPTNRKTDGKFHKIRVEVPPMDVNNGGKPIKFKVKHKQGYYAPRSVAGNR